MINRFLKWRIGRYLVSGGTAAAINLGLLYILVSLLHLWYLGATVIAFVVSFVASFILQKFFTFMEGSRERIPFQLGVYLGIILANLLVNVFLMFLIVDKLGMHYLIAQFFASGFIAIYSYFLYKYFVFHQTPTTSYEES